MSRTVRKGFARGEVAISRQRIYAGISTPNVSTLLVAPSEITTLSLVMTVGVVLVPAVFAMSRTVRKGLARGEVAISRQCIYAGISTPNVSTLLVAPSEITTLSLVMTFGVVLVPAVFVMSRTVRKGFARGEVAISRQCIYAGISTPNVSALLVAPSEITTLSLVMTFGVVLVPAVFAMSRTVRKGFARGEVAISRQCIPICLFINQRIVQILPFGI